MHGSLKPQNCSSFINKIVFGLAGAAIYSPIVCAGAMENIASSHHHQTVISLTGGFAGVHSGYSQSHHGTDNNDFSFNYREKTKNSGLVGILLGKEFTQLKFNPSVLFQTGLEYNYLGNNHLHGFNTVGIQPNTSTLYHYDYTFESQQLLAVAKVLTTTHQIYHPYFSVGLGAAFNHAGKYNAYTSETGSLNLTPVFHDKTQTEFSYALGIGVDTTVNDHVRLGLGYKFTDMGKASFGHGSVVRNSYSFPTNFSLIMPHVYANQIIAQVSYLA